MTRKEYRELKTMLVDLVNTKGGTFNGVDVKFELSSRSLKLEGFLEMIGQCIDEKIEATDAFEVVVTGLKLEVRRKD